MKITIDKKLEVKVIHLIYKTVYQNANELTEEAIVLYKKRRYARAIYLAQIALEKLEKSRLRERNNSKRF